MIANAQKIALFSLMTVALNAHFTTLEDAKEYDTLITSEKPFVLQFSAPWCGACEQIKKPVEEVAAESEFDSITVMRINSDAFRNLASTHAIRGIPTFIFFNNGEKVNTIVGVPEGQNIKDSFRNALREHLLQSNRATSSSINTQTQTPSEPLSIMDSIKNVIASITDYLSSLINKFTQIFTPKDPRS